MDALKMACRRFSGWRQKAKLVLVALIPLVTISSIHAQGQSSGENNYRIDRSSVRFKELNVGFQSLYGELTHRPVGALSEADQILVQRAITDTPYYQHSLVRLQAACDYYSSRGSAEVDVGQVARLISEANQMEYEGHESFLEGLYQAMSPSSQAFLDSLIEENSVSVANMRVGSLDIEKMARESSREVFNEHVSELCGRLPGVIEVYGGGTIVPQEVPLFIREQTQ